MTTINTIQCLKLQAETATNIIQISSTIQTEHWHVHMLDSNGKEHEECLMLDRLIKTRLDPSKRMHIFMGFLVHFAAHENIKIAAVDFEPIVENEDE